ncbi:uncharacterized protein LOC116308268 [Actinia tenebrosa]|uniref:Uncharacterized protein LOC116308268 n=1 Tax=Actinia tenebrosa TaxID=6105 RepID=A0A6P8J3D5_ACTTE|nr:uncharacterized protein LOC116308268 [Actinia tenebrosa]
MTRLERLQRVLCVLFSIFLVWRAVGALLYVIRAFVCCVEERRISFLCHNFTMYSHSLEIEICWVYSHIISQIISLVVLIKAPTFFGWKTLGKKLLRLPNYLSLNLLLLLTLVGYCAIFIYHKQTALEKTTNFAFIIKAILSVVLMAVLNFTPLSRLSGQHLFFRVLCKTTLCSFALDNALFCLVGTIQLAFRVNGLDRVHHLFSSEFHILFTALRRLTIVAFYYRITDFFWQKIFMDRNNLLSYDQKFEDRDLLPINSRERESYQALI